VKRAQDRLKDYATLCFAISGVLLGLMIIAGSVASARLYYLYVLSEGNARQDTGDVAVLAEIRSPQLIIILRI